MTPWQRQVEAFHWATGSTVGTRPAIGDAELRAKLIAEEAAETIAALGFGINVGLYRQHRNAPDTDVPIAVYDRPSGQPNLEEAVDGLADLIYVAIGSAVSMGVDLEPVFAEVHRANMAKAAGPKRADGKILKPEGWRPPDIARVLREQMIDEADVETVAA